MDNVNRISPRDLLVFVGAFLVVIAALAHFLAVDRFVSTLPNETTVTRSTAERATLLNPVTGQRDSGVRLDRRRSVELAEPPAPHLDAYVVSTTVQRADRSVVSRQKWRAVQEPKTGEAITSYFNTAQVTRFDANGNSVEISQPLRNLGGVVLRFERDTEQADHLRWDPTTGTVAVAEFVGRTRLEGSDVLEFRQRGTGQAGGADGNVSAESDTTVWVRPETGTVVKERAHVTTRLTDGHVVLDATFVDDARDVRQASQGVDAMVRSRTWSVVVGPAMIFMLGIGAFAAALFDMNVGWRPGRLRHARSTEDA